MFGSARRYGDVVEALVGGAVGADEPRAIEGEGHVEVLDADVVHHLVERALQEGRVDRRDGLHALGGEPGGEGHRVLLGDADVVEAVRVRLLEAVEAGAIGHRCGDRDDARVLVGELDQRVREDPRVAGRTGRGLAHLAGLDLERRHAVVLERIRLGRRVAVALRGERVQQDRSLAAFEHAARVVERLEHVVDAVAPDRAEVAEAERLEEQARRDEGLERLLGLVRPLDHVARQRRENLLGAPLIRRTSGVDILRDRNDESAPTLGAIDISLSLSTPSGSSAGVRRRD